MGEGPVMSCACLICPNHILRFLTWEVAVDGMGWVLGPVLSCPCTAAMSCQVRLMLCHVRLRYTFVMSLSFLSCHVIACLLCPQIYFWDIADVILEFFFSNNLNHVLTKARAKKSSSCPNAASGGLVYVGVLWLSKRIYSNIRIFSTEYYMEY